MAKELNMLAQGMQPSKAYPEPYASYAPLPRVPYGPSCPSKAYPEPEP